MSENYGRDLDLNLLRVFLAVVEQGSVTGAASHLYLTQPAVSAALRRLTQTIGGAPLFVRQGRGLVLTRRGTQLLATVRPHLTALIQAALSPGAFDPATSEYTFRIGLSDVAESWLLPALLRVLEREAPRMRVIAIPVQFRTVSAALASRQVDMAVTVADALPAGFKRQPLVRGGFVCLFDPRKVKFKKPLRERDYFAAEHVVVSYNGDLRGVVEDVVRKTRKVRCSVASFDHVGAIVDGSNLVATVPELVAKAICAVRPHLRTSETPFRLGGEIPLELIWPEVDEGDEAGRFVRRVLMNVVDSM